jgi:carboxyvinyl-carboxyphosphonate phosphorylmutase
MDWTDRRERLRAIISGPRCIYPGSVYDAISARIAEDFGFEAGMFAGSIASFTVLGAPDIVMLTLTEFAQQATASIAPENCRSLSMPITATAMRSMSSAPWKSSRPRASPD